MTMENEKDDDDKVKIVFAPGCFDAFEGTQEELDEMIADITKMAEEGTLEKQSQPIQVDDLSEEELKMLDKLLSDMDESDESDESTDDILEKQITERKRKLN